MPARFFLITLLLSAWIGATPSGVALAKDDISPAEAARNVLDDPAYQTKFPTESTGSGQKDHGTARPTTGTGPEITSSPVSGTDSPITKRLLYTLLVGVCLAIFVGLLLFLLSELGWLPKGWLPRFVRPGQTRSSQDSPKVNQEISPISLEEAKALAGVGKYSEAVHSLLLCAFTGIAFHQGRDLSKAWTGREVLRRTSVQGAARDSLEALVKIVERSLFGGRQVSKKEYLESLWRYERLNPR